MDINDLRVQIDEIDDSITRLFCERMRVSADIARYKKENDLPVLDKDRERQKLAAVLSKTEPEMRGYMSKLYMLLFELSRAYQDEINSIYG